MSALKQRATRYKPDALLTATHMGSSSTNHAVITPAEGP
jgi:hypothetical protein